MLKQPLEFLNGHVKMSGMKLNADGVCVMSGYEELLTLSGFGFHF